MKEDYKRPLSDTSDGSTNVDLKTKAVERGERLVLQRMSAIDETTAFTRLLFGIERTGHIDWFSQEESPSANEYYWDPHPVHLKELECFVARFVGTTNGDKLRCNLFGYVEKVER